MLPYSDSLVLSNIIMLKVDHGWLVAPWLILIEWGKSSRPSGRGALHK